MFRAVPNARYSSETNYLIALNFILRILRMSKGAWIQFHKDIFNRSEVRSSFLLTCLVPLYRKESHSSIRGPHYLPMETKRKWIAGEEIKPTFVYLFIYLLLLL